MGFICSFFFFSTLKSDEHFYAAMPLALSRDPGPTPSVGHVTGDMKRRESNETQIKIIRLRDESFPGGWGDYARDKITSARVCGKKCRRG